MNRRISVAIITLMFFIPTLLFAHGSFTHVLGTVTETTENQIVVQTIKGGVVTLTVTPETIYHCWFIGFGKYGHFSPLALAWRL